jgi:hypothetical protein
LRSTLAVAATAALVAGCGGKDDEGGYPDKAISNFVATCAKQPGSSEDACRCVIERLQITMPYDEFVATDEALREQREPAATSTAKLRAAAAGCR